MSDFEKLTPEQKNEIKQLLNEFAQEISDLNNDNIKSSLDHLKEEVSDLNFKNVKDFLDDFKAELNILKEYTEYKNIVTKLEQKIDKIEKEIINPTKDELANLQKHIRQTKDIENLSPEEIKKLAQEGRKKHSQEITGIVEKLAQRDDWIGKIARKIV